MICTEIKVEHNITKNPNDAGDILKGRVLHIQSIYRDYIYFPTLCNAYLHFIISHLQKRFDALSRFLQIVVLRLNRRQDEFIMHLSIPFGHLIYVLSCERSINTFSFLDLCFRRYNMVCMHCLYHNVRTFLLFKLMLKIQYYQYKIVLYNLTSSISIMSSYGLLKDIVMLNAHIFLR